MYEERHSALVSISFGNEEIKMREYLEPELEVVSLNYEDMIYTSVEKGISTNVIDMTSDFNPFRTSSEGGGGNM